MSTSDDLRAHLGALFGGGKDSGHAHNAERAQNKAGTSAAGSPKPQEELGQRAGGGAETTLKYPGTAPIIADIPAELPPAGVALIEDTSAESAVRSEAPARKRAQSEAPVVEDAPESGAGEAAPSAPPPAPTTRESGGTEGMPAPEYAPFPSTRMPDTAGEAELDAWFAGETERSDFNASGYEFAREEAIFELPPPDEWPAFTDADTAAERERIAREEAEAQRRAEEEAAARAVPQARALRRFAGAIAVLGVAAGAAYGVMRSNTAPDVYEAPIAQAAPSPQHLACFGSFTRAFDTGIDVYEVDEGIAQNSRVYATGSALIGTKRVPAGITEGGELAGVIAGEAEGTAIAGATIHSAQAGDMRGLASAACAQPVMDALFVGSRSLVGTSNDLILVNPGATPIDVHAQAFGSAGELSLSSAERIVVAAGELKRVSLDGLLDADSRITVRLTSDSGSFAAALQSTSLDGADPAGVAYVPPSHVGTHLIIPGISAAGTAAAPSLRLANPSEEAVSAHVTLMGDGGPAALDGLEEVEIGPLSVLDISLAGIDSGVYTAVVDASSDIAAGAELIAQDSEDSPRDVAWAAAVRPISEGRSILAASASRLALYTDGDAHITITPIEGDGSEGESIAVDVPSGQARVIDVPAAPALRVSGDAAVYAGIFGLTPVSEGNGVDWAGFTPRTEAAAARHIAIR